MQNLILGFILGVLSNFLIRSFFAIKAEDVNLINDHIADIEEIESLAKKYWSTDSETCEKTEQIDAASLEAMLSVSLYFEEHARRLMGQLYDDYAEKDVELYDNATGGNFRSSGRNFCPNRVAEIIVCCDEMRALLRKARRAMYWAR